MPRRLATELVHAGARDVGGAVVTPIFQTANFRQEDSAEYGAVRYARLQNSPQHEVLCRRLATIEGADDALPFASGMAAVAAPLLALLRPGDHLLVQRNTYGGTHTFLREDLARWGVTFTEVDAAAPETWRAGPSTRMFWVEAVSNPLLDVPELDAVVRFARAHGLVSVIDNTFQSPVGFRPIPFGFDLVVHSATKYLNGHSDLVAGVVAGGAERMRTLRRAAAHLGASLDPHAAFLLERGLKTLAVRVPHQVRSAGRIAAFLAEHPAVATVRYPGLPGDPSHARAARYFGHPGAMVTFETRTEAAADAFLARVTLAANAASLGGVESLVVKPARSSHLGLSPAERAALGISDRMVRVSVGLEDADDLLEDFAAALA